MSVELLPASRVRALRGQPLSYDGVGGTAAAAPPGYASFSRTRRLPRADFATAAEALMSWQVQARSGLRLRASSQRVELDGVVVLSIGFGPARLTIPCRIVRVVDEPDRQGFAYGTLPGHPEAGEEAFVLSRRPDGGVDFTVTAFSRPATRPARLGGPATTVVQRLMTERYLRALG